LGPGSRRALADDKIPDLTAHPMYSGGFVSMTFGPGLVEFDITRQEGRHFWGVVTMDFGGMAPMGFMFDGTVTPTPNELPGHEFKARGKGPAGDVLVDGTVTDLGDGFFLNTFTYMFMSPTGVMDEGTGAASDRPSGGC
jgi:hypothetical protein